MSSIGFRPRGSMPVASPPGRFSGQAMGYRPPVRELVRARQLDLHEVADERVADRDRHARDKRRVDRQAHDAGQHAVGEPRDRHHDQDDQRVARGDGEEVAQPVGEVLHRG